ncbi:hypothetical protein ACLB2K_037529 [Fragaria x ananassa]
MATMGEINFPSTTKSPWSEPPTPKTSRSYVVEESDDDMSEKAEPKPPQEIGQYLLTRSYITGYQALKDDITMQAARSKPPSSEYGCFWRRLGVRIEGCAPINHHKGSTQLPHLLLVIQRICIKLLYFCVRIWYNTQASVAEDKMMMKVLWISLVADLRGEEGC